MIVSFSFRVTFSENLQMYLKLLIYELLYPPLSSNRIFIVYYKSIENPISKTLQFESEM